MNPYDALAALTDYAGRNIAYHLTFFPEERLYWKPEPTAKSAMEIVQHAVLALRGGLPMLSGGEWTPVEVPMPAGLAEAQEQIQAAARAYADGLRSVDPASLEGMVATPVGEVPRREVITWAAFDVIHHHGQIAYLETLFGDTEDHFTEP